VNRKVEVDQVELCMRMTKHFDWRIDVHDQFSTVKLSRK